MRFIDSNVFLYAFIKARKPLKREIAERKNRAKRILHRVENGEEVATTVIHLGEVANILESKVGLSTSIKFVESMLLAKNIKVFPVSTDEYLRAVLLAKEKYISINDALAYIKMKKAGIKEIYTFDRHFKNLDVKVIQE